MLAFPLQLLDNFLLDYHVGQALLLVFILATLAGLAQGSQKIMGIQWSLFGLIFLVTPTSLQPVEFQFLGLALLFIGPMLYVTARR